MTDLFDYQPPPPAPKYPDAPGHNFRDTSKDAAKSMEPHVSRLAADILGRLRAKSSTAHEIEASSGMRMQTISARIRELTLKGYLEDSGERRPTPSGRNAIVWRVKEGK